MWWVDMLGKPHEEYGGGASHRLHKKQMQARHQSHKQRFNDNIHMQWHIHWVHAVQLQTETHTQLQTVFMWLEIGIDKLRLRYYMNHSQEYQPTRSRCASCSAWSTSTSLPMAISNKTSLMHLITQNATNQGHVVVVLAWSKGDMHTQSLCGLGLECSQWPTGGPWSSAASGSTISAVRPIWTCNTTMCTKDRLINDKFDQQTKHFTIICIV